MNGESLATVVVEGFFFCFTILIGCERSPAAARDSAAVETGSSLGVGLEPRLEATEIVSSKRPVL